MILNSGLLLFQNILLYFTIDFKYYQKKNIVILIFSPRNIIFFNFDQFLTKISENFIFLLTLYETVRISKI